MEGFLFLKADIASANEGQYESLKLLLNRFPSYGGPFTTKMKCKGPYEDGPLIKLNNLLVFSFWVLRLA